MELQHHGVRGMKWGVRRFQNTDGSLTSAGQKRYGLDGADKKALKGQVQKKAHAGYGNANLSNGGKSKFMMDQNQVIGKGSNRKEAKADYKKEREKYADKNAGKWLKDGGKASNYGLTKKDIDGYVKRHPEQHSTVKKNLGISEKAESGRERANRIISNMGNQLASGMAKQAAYQQRVNAVNAMMSGDFGTMFLANSRAKQFDSIGDGYAERVKR